MRILLLAIVALSGICCADFPGPSATVLPLPDSLRTVADIPLPAGFHRLDTSSQSFAGWLRSIPLRSDRTVYLYNGLRKANQSAQYAVLDVSVGNSDLQQCADAVMRLRAEYLFSQQRFGDIRFFDNADHEYLWTGGGDRDRFARYLLQVFARCGTASLERQLRRQPTIREVQAGDVLVRGGFPGHAMMVMDVVVNADGERRFLLAQSYMPAQDIHIVRNPNEPGLNPWYKALDGHVIETPEWTFFPGQLRRG